ncbi:YceI-like domain protein (fragment) [Candidatus Filomicrobium marinum]|uniref:YceI-like domain protein n=2 Tax=Filomicrobium TaxID=119044 RepID=A0A0D6JF24_9HYPH
MNIFKRTARALAACVVAVAAAQFPAAPSFAAQNWDVIDDQSTIGFAGTHAGRPFTGTFQSWEADISFDPSDLASSRAEVTVDLASAITGDATYDKTLPTTDWFNVSQIAQAKFVTTDISQAADGRSFNAEGLLSIRGVDVPVTLTFNFIDQGQDARLEGTASLKRLDFGIGKGSDADGAWVSLDIPVTVSVMLKRAD